MACIVRSAQIDLYSKKDLRLQTSHSDMFSRHTERLFERLTSLSSVNKLKKQEQTFEKKLNEVLVWGGRRQCPLKPLCPMISIYVQQMLLYPVMWEEPDIDLDNLS